VILILFQIQKALLFLMNKKTFERINKDLSTMIYRQSNL